MATIFTHALVGGTVAYTLFEPLNFSDKDKFKFYLLMSLLPIVPDFDYVGYLFRVPYESFWGHRGFTHSILFSAILAWIALLFVFYNKAKKEPFIHKTKIYIIFFLTTLTHATLDAMTNGGLGIAFYSPFNIIRYFFNYRPIKVSPMGIHFFSERGLMVLVSELYWVWIPCLFFVSLKKIYVLSKKK